MHRTNLYLTEEQERALDSRARAAGVSRSALVREIIDRELAGPGRLDREVEAALRVIADGYHEAIDGLFAEDPDLRIEH